MTVEEIIKELRRPFAPEAVSYKIQSAKGKKALIVCFVDARQVGERLNLVCPERWGDSYREVESGGMSGIQCTIQVQAAEAIITRSDVGIMEGGIGGLKAVYSDAFKRAATKFGVGVPLYYSPRFYADKADLDSRGENFYLSRKVEGQARQNYAKWLAEEGIKRFGETLDLGDSLEDQGDVEVAPEVEVEEPTLPPAKDNGEGTITGEEAAKLREYFRTVSASLPKAKADSLATQIRLWLNSQAADSLEDLNYEQAERLHDYISTEAE